MNLESLLAGLKRRVTQIHPATKWIAGNWGWVTPASIGLGAWGVSEYLAAIIAFALAGLVLLLKAYHLETDRKLVRISGIVLIAALTAGLCWAVNVQRGSDPLSKTYAKWEESHRKLQSPSQGPPHIAQTPIISQSPAAPSPASKQQSKNPAKTPLPPSKAGLRITSVAMSNVSRDNKMTTEVDYVNESNDTIAALGTHALIILPVPPPAAAADFSAASREAEKAFRAAEESAWSQFEVADHKFERDLAFGNPPSRPEHLTQTVDLSSRFSPDQIQAVREGKSTLFLVGVLSYMSGKIQVDVPYCLATLDGEGNTVYCSQHN